MKQPRILIVDSNHRRARKLQDAISEAILAPPVCRDNGESAVLWIGANTCDLCILSYELPGINGLETLVRMRSRRPNLPAIIIAESTEQHVAIAAFRTGVLDFIPATGSFARIVAETVQNALGQSSRLPEAPLAAVEDPTLAHIPPERLAPTYQNRLRSMGRQLDVYQFHSVTFVEVEGGFLVRAQKQRSRRPQVLEFADQDFPRMVASAIHDDISRDEKPIHQSELTPTGYEDVLRALGYRLDQRSAEAIVLTELEEMFVVSGRGRDDMSVVPGLVPFEIMLRQADIDLMLNEAFHRRGKEQPRIKQPAHGSGGLRNILRRLN